MSLKISDENMKEAKVKIKTVPHEGKKLPFGTFSFRVIVDASRESLLHEAFSKLHCYLRETSRGFHKSGGSVGVEFRCQGAIRKTKIIEHFISVLKDCKIQNSIDGKFEV